jgi:hypothetical protein
MSGGGRDDNPISVVEDLDPEPDQVRGRAWWRSPRVGEVILGLLLLFGVIGWAGFTSWQDDSNSSNYEQGRQDESLRHWDEALAHYSSARGYKDADARAAQTSKQILARDTQYQAAKSYEQNGDATQMLLATQAVQTIEPGYKDVDKMALQAQNQVYTDVLSGSVVLRTGVSPQGLYYRGAAGWVYLQGSDRWSSVLSVPFSATSANRVVYDVPGPDWGNRTPLTRLPFDPYDFQITQGLPDKVGRRVELAILPETTAAPKFESLQLDAVKFNFYICGEAGVWGIRYTPGMPDTVIAKGTVDGFAPTYEQLSDETSDAGSIADTVSAVAMPGTDGVVADFGHQSIDGTDQLLLAAHAPGTNINPVTQLFLTRADGSQPRVVFSTTDLLVSTQLSPDDQHALVVTSGVTRVGSVPKQLVAASLLTLDGTAPPKLLQKIAVDGLTWSTGGTAMLQGQLTISGVFLENGTFSNKLLLGWADNSSARGVTVRLLDVSNPDKVLAETSIQYEQIGVLAVLEQVDNRTLLLYNQGVPPVYEGDGPPLAQVDVLRTAAGTDDVETTSYNVPLPQGGEPSGSTPYLMYPSLHGNDLIYSVEAFTTHPETSDIYSLDLAGASAQSAEPAQVSSGSWSSSQANGRVWPAPRVAGPGAYGYVDLGGTLHAHAYDSQADLSLETGVGNIFVLSANYFYKVLH